jgi:hypothetical protein
VDGLDLDYEAIGAARRNVELKGVALVLIIFVVTTAVAGASRKRLVTEGASAALPQRKGQLPGAIPQVSCSWL